MKQRIGVQQGAEGERIMFCSVCGDYALVEAILSDADALVERVAFEQEHAHASPSSARLKVARPVAALSA